MSATHALQRGFTRLPLILALAVILPGCSSKKSETISVAGTVRLDGEPVRGARVLFCPKGKGRPAEGLTDDAGRFELSTFRSHDGALPGEHAVTVTLMRIGTSAAKPLVEGSEEAMMASVASVSVKPPEWIVPMKYSDQNTSGLSAMVSPESREFKFELKKRP
jgi:hypothetical protein